MITVTGATSTELQSGTGEMIWWVDLQTNETTPEKFTFRTHYDSSWADTFEHGTATGLKGDVQANTDWVHLKEVPGYTREAGKSLVETSVIINIAGVENEGGDMADFLDAVANKVFDGGEMAFGFYSPVSGEKVVIDEGRPNQTEWGPEVIVFECVNSVEIMKGKIPSGDLCLDQWALREDTEDNPDPDHPFQGLTAIIGTANGRYRKGQKQTITNWAFTAPFYGPINAMSYHFVTSGFK